MPAIVWMTGLAILLIAALGAAVLNHLTRSDHRYYWLALLSLPSSFLVNRLVKIPFIIALGNIAGIPLKLGTETPLWFIAAIWLAAPIFEEAVKILPMALPMFRSLLKEADHALCAGLALGIGFGLGEVAYLAYSMMHSADINSLPWYMFLGFVTDRLFVSFGHGLMTAIAVLGLHHGSNKAFFGYLTAMGFHALINLGPILSALKLISASVAGVGSYIAILGAFAFFQRQFSLARKRKTDTPTEIVYFNRE